MDNEWDGKEQGRAGRGDGKKLWEKRGRVAGAHVEHIIAQALFSFCIFRMFARRPCCVAHAQSQNKHFPRHRVLDAWPAFNIGQTKETEEGEEWCQIGEDDRSQDPRQPRMERHEETSNRIELVDLQIRGTGYDVPSFCKPTPEMLVALEHIGKHQRQPVLLARAFYFLTVNGSRRYRCTSVVHEDENEDGDEISRR